MQNRLSYSSQTPIFLIFTYFPRILLWFLASCFSKEFAGKIGADWWLIDYLFPPNSQQSRSSLPEGHIHTIYKIQLQHAHTRTHNKGTTKNKLLDTHNYTKQSLSRRYAALLPVYQWCSGELSFCSYSRVSY